MLSDLQDKSATSSNFEEQNSSKSLFYYNLIKASVNSNIINSPYLYPNLFPDEINNFRNGEFGLNYFSTIVIPWEKSQPKNKNESNNEQTIRFLTKVHKRGRKTEDIDTTDTTIIRRKKNHLRTAFDNLQTKIQVHFISFMINISNDALSTEFGNNKILNNLKDISYDIKKRVNYKTCGDYKNSTIKEILNNNISTKYKHFNKDINKDILNKACKLSNWLNEFFNMKYLELFDYYYNKGKPLESFIFNGKNITLSIKTKSFYDLILKYRDDKIKLIETVKSVYFYGYDELVGKKPFKTI